MSRREFLDFVLEQMSQLRGLRSRSMFGGFGIYQGDLFFALIADDRLYLKTDAINRPDFLARGLGPFVYGAKGKTASMQYYEVPPEVYEDLDSMRLWAEKGIAAAQRAAISARAK
jgi:DNA transformation protein and related proteins